MTDVSRDAPTRPGRRRWWSILLAVALLVAAGLGIVAAWSAHYFDRLDQLCPWYASEGIMAAPRSAQGRVVCGAEGIGSDFWWAVLGSVGVPLALALVLWLCRRLVRALVALLLAAALPVVIAETSVRLEGSCSEAQWAAYGEDGCERDREQR